MNETVVCSACQAPFEVGQFTSEHYQLLCKQAPYESFFDEFEMLLRVQDLFERYPGIDGKIRPKFTQLVESCDTRVWKQLLAGVPLNRIEAPPGGYRLPEGLQGRDREVIDHLRYNDFLLGPRLEFVTGKLAELGEARKPLVCAACGQGRLRIEAPDSDDREESGNFLAFYRPHPNSILPDGTLHIRTSWYDADSHSSGYIEVEPSDPEYRFWLWTIELHERFQHITSKELDQLRAEFEQSCSKKHLPNRDDH